jgi:hypothetical protein
MRLQIIHFQFELKRVTAFAGIDRKVMLEKNRRRNEIKTNGKKEQVKSIRNNEKEERLSDKTL